MPLIRKDDEFEELKNFLPIFNEFLLIAEQEISENQDEANLFFATNFRNILTQLNQFLIVAEELDLNNLSKSDSADNNQKLLFNEINSQFVIIINRFCDEMDTNDLKELSLDIISNEIPKYESFEEFDAFLDEKIGSYLTIKKEFLKHSLDIFHNHKAYYDKLVTESVTIKIKDIDEKILKKMSELTDLEKLTKNVSLELFFIHNSLETGKNKLEELRKLLYRFKRISLEELSILLNFKFVDSLKIWIEGYREVLKFKIERNEIIFIYESDDRSRDYIIREIDSLLEDFDKWEKSGIGKKTITKFDDKKKQN